MKRREEIMTAQPATGKQPRFPQLSMDQLDDKQRPLGEEIVKVSSVGLGGPYNPIIRSPVLGQRLLDLFHYLRWETSVPMRHRGFPAQIVKQVEQPLAQYRTANDRIVGSAKTDAGDFYDLL